MSERLQTILLVLVVLVVGAVCLWLANEAIGRQVCNQTRLDDPQFDKMQCMEYLR